MILNLLPTRFLVTRAARAYGFLDPVSLLASLRSFAQPSEVGEPIELLRAGMLFHARGLVNTKACSPAVPEIQTWFPAPNGIR